MTAKVCRVTPQVAQMPHWGTHFLRQMACHDITEAGCRLMPHWGTHLDTYGPPCPPNALAVSPLLLSFQTTRPPPYSSLFILSSSQRFSPPRLPTLQFRHNIKSCF